jgi:hypothetical protein
MEFGIDLVHLEQKQNLFVKTIQNIVWSTAHIA